MPSHHTTSRHPLVQALVCLDVGVSLVTSRYVLQEHVPERLPPDPDAIMISVEAPSDKHDSLIDDIDKVLIGPTIPLIGDLNGDSIPDALGDPRDSNENEKPEDNNTGLMSRGEAVGDISPLPTKLPLEKRRKLRDKLPEDARKPPRDDDTYITLINATPYRWRKGYNHQYQMFYWDDWADYIEPGESFQYLSTMWGPSHSDSAGEVAYHLEGTSKPMSFMIERRKGKGHNTHVRFLEDLEARDKPKDSEHDLGAKGLWSSSLFILAGEEDDFWSNDPPVAWMQDMLAEIGELPLREIIMPRSHHAGLWKSKHKFHHGNQANTATQIKDLEFQLTQGGSRVLDLRPNLYKGKIWEGHGSYVLNNWAGTLGATLDDMIDTINDFQKKYPGELIIWDVHPDDAWYVPKKLGIGEHTHKEMREEDREIMYKTFKKLKNRLSVPDDEDITRWPLEKFIGNETSAVLIRVGGDWGEEDIFPGGEEGFVSPENFPYSHRWSNTDVPEDMYKDQLDSLSEARPNRHNPLHHTDWLLTQQSHEVTGWFGTIPELNEMAWTGLYKALWDGIDEDTYPNWLAVDGIECSDLASLVVTLNHCLVARKCGGLGGKVEVPQDEDEDEDKDKDKR